MFDIKPGTVCTNSRNKKDENGDDVTIFVKVGKLDHEGKKAWDGQIFDEIDHVNEWECTHEAKSAWTGDEGIMGAIHGAWTPWCECCMLKAQIEHANKAAERLPKLVEKLKVACDV